MTKSKVSRIHKLRFFRRVAELWRQAASLQARRCISDEVVPSVESRIDFTFYVVAVTRLREVAWQLHKRLQVAEMKEAVERLDSRWPRLKELRNSDEHMKGMPSGEFPFGIWYFGQIAADLRPGGQVDFVLETESAEEDVDILHQAIIQALDSELAQADESTP